MVARHTATSARQTQDRIQYFLEKGHYLTRDNMEVRKLARECEALIKTDAAQAYVAYSYLAQLCGEKEEALSAAVNAQKLGGAPGEEAAICALVNLGWFTEAQPKASLFAAPAKGRFSAAFGLLLAAGSVQETWQFLQGLPKMGIDAPKDMPEFVKEAAAILRAANLPDADVASVLDAAGEVLRANRLLYVGPGPEVSVERHSGGGLVHFLFRIACTPKETAKVNWQLASLMAEKPSATLQRVHVSFGIAA